MIREFKENDMHSVMKLWLETNIAAHNFIHEDYWKSNYDNVKQMLPEATIFVYEENGSIQGFIGLSQNYIAGLFVETICQSKGIGKALLNHIKERHIELLLQVYKKNNRAVNFYLREGFSIIHEQIDKNTNEIEYIMKWCKYE